MATAVRNAAETGGYGSVDAVVREALVHWMVAEQMSPVTTDDLAAMLRDGLHGPGVPLEDVAHRLKAKYAAMAAAQGRSD